MTSPTNQYKAAETRRHSDSVTLWVLVLAGSLLIHLILFLMAHLVLKQSMDGVQTDPTPISVELFDSPTNFSSTPPDQFGKAAPLKATSAQDASRSSSPDVQEAAPSQDVLLSKLGSEGSQVPERSPVSPSLSVNRSLRSTPKASSNQPIDNSKAAPTSSSPDKSASSTTNTSPATINTSPEIPVEGPVESGVLLPVRPDVPNPADNPGLNEQDAPSATRPLPIGRNPIPAAFSAQIKPIAPTDELDTPTYPATIQGERSKSFSSNASGCLLTPAAFRTFKQPVVLKVPLNEGGDIDKQQSILVQQSSGDDSYDDLAICTLKSWNFEPAYTLRDGSKFYKPSRLNVEIVITQR